MAVAILLGTVGVSAAQATTVYVEGGVWSYGVRSGGTYGTYGEVYSRYNHPSRMHRATACGLWGCQGSNWVRGTVPAEKIQPAKGSGNLAYYNVS
jgi:hypothetical protein